MTLSDDDTALPSQPWLDAGWDLYELDYLTEVLGDALADMEDQGYM